MISHSFTVTARGMLAVAFPPEMGLKGAVTTLRDLCRPAYRTPGSISRVEAVSLCIRRNMEHAEAYGHRNRYQRRADHLAFCRELAAWQNAQGGLTEADVDRYAEQRGEVVVPAHAVDFQP